MSWIPSYKKPSSEGGGVEIVTWADGTDEQIVAMVDAHYNNEIDLTEYWAVGDERIVHLSAMSATGVGESHVAQDVIMVLLNVGGKTLTTSINGYTECVFVVGQKNYLSESGYMDDRAYNSNVADWENSKRRIWCNSVYKNSLPSSIAGIFKQHKNFSESYATSDKTTDDYFALPSYSELWNQLSYYKGNTIHRKKYDINGQTQVFNGNYWLRDEFDNYYGTNRCKIYSTENESFGYEYVNGTCGIAPQSVI